VRASFPVSTVPTVSGVRSTSALLVGLIALSGAVVGGPVGCGAGDGPRPILEASTTQAARTGADDPTVVAADATTTPAWGAAHPVVVVTVFADLESRLFGQVYPLLDRLVGTYPEDVQIQFRHRPDPFHAAGIVASQALMAAHRQGAFRPYLDFLWRYRGAWTVDEAGVPRRDTPAFRLAFVELAEKMGLDGERFARDLGVDPAHAGDEEGVAKPAKAILDKLNQDAMKAVMLTGRGVPMLAVNGRSLRVGNRDLFGTILRAVRAERRKAYALMAQGLKRDDVVTRRVIENTRNPRAARWLIADEPLGEDDATKAKAKAKRSGRTITKEVWKVPTGRGTPSQGAQDALVTLVEFSDFQCPYCARLRKTVEALVAAYPQDVRLVFRNYPLEFHPHAKGAALAALCAHAQGKFWAMHDALFDHQGELGDALYDKLAAQLGLDVARFDACRAAPETSKRLEADMAAAQEVGVTGTPALFINGRKASGALPYAQLRAVIDEELAAARKRAPRDGRGEALYAKIIEHGKVLALLDPEVQKTPNVGAPRLGPADAPLKLTVFSDFQCPYCRRAAPVLERVIEDHPGEASLSFIHFPLSFHHFAERAAKVALCAQREGKFWPVHDALFGVGGGAPRLNDEVIDQAITKAGLDPKVVAACVADPGTAARLEAHKQAGADAHVRGTPTVLVNGRRLLVPVGRINASFDRLLKLVREK